MNLDDLKLNDDVLQLLKVLQLAPPPANYTTVDKYRDFRRVFLYGDATEIQGRRVLHFILDMANFWQSPARDSSLETYRMIGQHDIVRSILNIIIREPQELPKVAMTEKPEE